MIGLDERASTIWRGCDYRRNHFAVKPRSGYHESVLLQEAVEALEPAPGKVLIDGTLGGGGHAAALLAAGARVIAFDHDSDAIRHATEQLSDYRENLITVQSSFTRVEDVLGSLGLTQIDGALLDLGVSSHQLDEAARGFSFMREGPLDMRMDPRQPVTAADLVNSLSVEQLEDILRTYGEEPSAGRIAAHIARERALKPFATTLQLADAIERVIPRRGRTHPATRAFQALRIAVNRELELLEQGLHRLTQLLAPGSRLAVITFHSLEDRIVKSFFAARSMEWLDRPEWPAPQRNPDFLFKRITRKAVVAGSAEQRANPRARSAKLRVVEKLPESHGF